MEKQQVTIESNVSGDVSEKSVTKSRETSKTSLQQLLEKDEATNIAQTLQTTIQASPKNVNGFFNDDEFMSPSEVGIVGLWSSKATSSLIKLYKEYIVLVGRSTRFKSGRDMYDRISQELQLLGFHFTGTQCETKWRVLERKYMKYIEREGLTGPGQRKLASWEHKKSLDEIFGPKLRGRTKSVNNNNNEVSIRAHDLLQATALETALKKIGNDIQIYFEDMERNNERRHKEVMAIRMNELEIQKQLLEIKKKKLDLRIKNKKPSPDRNFTAIRGNQSNDDPNQNIFFIEKKSIVMT